MSRDIKFRAWDGEKLTQGFSFERWQGMMSVRGLELMQYTGLKDKNGVEIYEGDLIRTTNEDNGSVAIVECEYVGDNSSGQGGCFRFNGWIWNDLPQVHGQRTMNEVVGNIYENPDALGTNGKEGDK